MNRWTGTLLGLSLALLLGSSLLAEDEKSEAKKAEGQKAQAENKEAGAKKAQAEGEKAKAQAKEAEAKKAAGERKARPKGKQATLAEMKLKELAKIELTEEQTEKIKALAAEVQPKLDEARRKVNELIPAETRKAQQEAQAKARAEGKKPQEVTAFKLTEEQAAAQKAVRDIQQDFNKKVSELLTAEQKQALRKVRQAAGEKAPAKEKKPEAKDAPKKAEPKDAPKKVEAKVE
jgi:hypothetical protein